MLKEEGHWMGIGSDRTVKVYLVPMLLHATFRTKWKCLEFPRILAYFSKDECH